MSYSTMLASVLVLTWIKYADHDIHLLVPGAIDLERWATSSFRRKSAMIAYKVLTIADLA